MKATAPRGAAVVVLILAVVTACGGTTGGTTQSASTPNAATTTTAPQQQSLTVILPDADQWLPILGHQAELNPVAVRDAGALSRQDQLGDWSHRECLGVVLPALESASTTAIGDVHAAPSAVTTTVTSPGIRPPVRQRALAQAGRCVITSEYRSTSPEAGRRPRTTPQPVSSRSCRTGRPPRAADRPAPAGSADGAARALPESGAHRLLVRLAQTGHR